MFRLSLTKSFAACISIALITLSAACTHGENGAGKTAEPAASGAPGEDMSGLVTEDIPGTSIKRAREVDANGVLKIEGYLLDGKKTGQWIEYTPDGDIVLINSYVNGLLDGVVTRMSYRNQVNLRIHYKNGKMDGQYTAYKFGKLVEERYYKEDKLDGVSKTYDDHTFKLKQEVEYKNGLQDGFFRYYDEDGKLSLEYQYKNGEKVSGGIISPAK